MERGLPCRPSSRAAKAPVQPSRPPPGHLRAQGKVQPQGRRQHEERHFYGAASRKRAMELLGQLDPLDDGMPRNSKANKKTPREPPASQRTTCAAPPDDSSLMLVTAPSDSSIVERGLPAQAPLVSHNEALQSSGLLSNAATILQDLLEGDEVELDDDGEWQKYPEIGQAAKAAGADERSMCIAICASRGVWGVGLGGNVKVRARVAKLALCVALAETAREDVGVRWPDFMNFALNNAMPGSNHDGRPDAFDLAPAAKARKRNNGKNEVDHQPGAPVHIDTNCLPRDTPLWVELPVGEPRPEKLANIGFDEALVISTDGNGRKGFYSQAGRVLEALVPEAQEGDIEYHDDSNWADFPAVGAALKAIAGSEECMTVATCTSKDVWAVGVGSNKRIRFGAATAALAASIAIRAVDADEELPERVVGNAMFVKFIEEARQARN